MRRGFRRARCGTGWAGSGCIRRGVRAFFTGLAGALSPDPVPLDPAGGTRLADAAASVGAAFAAAGIRWAALAVSAWEFAAVQTRGSLLSPLVVFRAVRGDAMASAPA